MQAAQTGGAGGGGVTWSAYLLLPFGRFNAAKLKRDRSTEVSIRSHSHDALA